MLDIYLIWASSMLLVVVFFFEPPFWAKIAMLIFAIFALIIVWRKMNDPDDEEFF